MKLLFLIPFIYFLTLFQASFMVFFDFKGYVFNLVLTVVLLFNLFENQKKISGLILAIFSGFFLDIFSSGISGINFLGLWALILLIVSFFIKYILKWINIKTLNPMRFF